jgi:exodeoxyribonuclease V alpha subunit
MEQLTGQISRIVYRNEENGWTVMELFDDTGEEYTATGTLPLCVPGERVQLTGQFVMHKSYGRQFKAQSALSVAPATLGALESYLGCGIIKGVGEATAKRLVQHFQMDTLRVLEEEPERLREISGIGKTRAEMIAASFFQQRHMRDILIHLQGFGITVRQAMKFYQYYGKDCIARLEENPYQLIEDVEGVGFKTADSIALRMGIAPDSRMRLRAGIKYMLSYARSEGHTYLPKSILLATASDLLGADQESIEDALRALILESELVTAFVEDEEAIYLPSLYYTETDAAKRLLALHRAVTNSAAFDTAQELVRLEAKLHLSLSEDQRNAIVSALQEGTMVITGGPGTGKTTILQFILHLLTSLHMDFALCAPTGRAAKRMTEASGFEASTIPRLLEYGRDGQLSFTKNAEDPLYFDMVIVDEMSMVDLPLFHALLRALPVGTRLVMVGDADQLPPVGAGTVLHDIIQSSIIPVIRLTNIYRQAGRSGIVLNAHRINEGETPVPDPDSDFSFYPSGNADQILIKILDIYAGRHMPFVITDPYKDIQILSPTRKGPLGVKALNQRLQQALNPPSPEKAEREYGETLFREGDKVMQIKHNYRMEWTKRKPSGGINMGEGVYNGDLGTVYGINEQEQLVTVLLDDDRLCTYTYTELEELELAYCISIHKSQGSEFPVVILPLMGGPPMLMTRNLLYTAVTRARSQVFILGDWQHVLQMVENRRMRKRYSALKERLMDMNMLMKGNMPYV